MGAGDRFLPRPFRIRTSENDMTEITRVPLQPISKGSLTKLWLAIALVIVAAAVIAWAVMPRGVTVEEVAPGEGPFPGETDVVFVNYTGRLEDGTVFEQSQPLPLPIPGVLPSGTPLPLENMVPGFREALMKMQRGGTYVAQIPSSKAYGESPPAGAPIPPNADLTFTIELVDFMPMDEFQGRVQAIQQMMAQQMGPPGGAQGQVPEGAAPPVQ